MVIYGLTRISPLRLAAKCSDAGLYHGKGGGKFRELTLGVYHLFLASDMAILATLLFACGNDGLVIFFA